MAHQQTVSIVGDGPAGCALAVWLKRAGWRVSLFAPGRRPDLVVGESLVPAVIPLLADLGVEAEVARYSVRKPGATFTLADGQRLQFTFAEVPGAVTSYAWNVPRDRFDATLRQAAERAGARIVPRRARLVAAAGERIALDPASLAATGLERQPDLVIDASGRARVVARLLGLAADEGQRHDLALFAHWSGDIPLARPGDVHTDRVDHGWAWRIPLPGRVSLGLVAPRAALEPLGGDALGRYEAFIAGDPHLAALTARAERLTSVAAYSNYALTSRRAVGPNWVLAGDAFGFVDPVFSSGLFLALHGAHGLARALVAGHGLGPWARRHGRHIDAWRAIVDTFYSGRLMTLFRVGEAFEARSRLGRLVGRHMRRHLPRVFTGEATSRPYSLALLRFMTRYGLNGVDPAPLAVI